MIVQDVLSAVIQAGGRLTPHGEKITVEAPMPLPQDVLALIREHKQGLLNLLEAFEERRAIVEYCGGLPRAEAEKLAWNCVLRVEVPA
jgi:hypothetical protein